MSEVTGHYGVVLLSASAEDSFHQKPAPEIDSTGGAMAEAPLLLPNTAQEGLQPEQPPTVRQVVQPLPLQLPSPPQPRPKPQQTAATGLMQSILVFDDDDTDSGD